MSAKDWVADVEFVLSECVRLAQDRARLGTSAWFKSLSKDDAMSFLPHPSGTGSLFCGREAIKRLHHLANVAIRNSDAQGTLTSELVYQSLRTIIVHRFIRDRRPQDTQQVQKALSAAVREAKTARYDATHFIPCRLASTSEPDQFSVGPVIFRPRTAFYAHLQPHVEALAVRRKDAGLFAPEDWTRIENYYGTFDWVAEVRVRNCDPDISQERARWAVTAAVDILQVVFGASYTKRMAIGGPTRVDDRRVHLRLGRNDELHLTHSWQATSPVSLSELGKLLTNPEVAFLLEGGGQAIEAVVDPTLDRPLSRRLIDAASWYGQAVREEFEAARIVKAMTALERLLMTADVDDIASTLGDRGAALAWHPTSRFDFAGWKGRIKKAYDIRSQLVHGSLSPFDPEVGLRSSWCVWLSEEVLQAACGTFRAISGFDRHVLDSDLSAWFGQLVERAIRGKMNV